MARYRASLHTRRSQEETFDYLSDFSNSREWDPSIVRAERVSPARADAGPGDEFRLVARFLGSESALTYRRVEYDRPNTVVFHAESDAVVSHDRITFASAPHGTTIVYDARLDLKGYRKLFEPLAALAFKRLGDRALDGLRRTLGG